MSEGGQGSGVADRIGERTVERSGRLDGPIHGDAIEGGLSVADHCCGRYGITDGRPMLANSVTARWSRPSLCQYDERRRHPAPQRRRRSKWRRAFDKSRGYEMVRCPDDRAESLQAVQNVRVFKSVSVGHTSGVPLVNPVDSPGRSGVEPTVRVRSRGDRSREADRSIDRVTTHARKTESAVRSSVRFT